MRQTVGFIGLGLIGLPAAINLVQAGYDVVGYGLENLDKLAAAGGKAAESCAAVAAAADVVFHCLPDHTALDSAVFGPQGTLQSLRRNATVIELSSYPLSAKEKLRAALQAASAQLLDCELTTRGGPAAMPERDCLIFISGDGGLAERMRPLFDAISKRAVYVGPFGASLKLKTVNNLLVGVHTLAAAEAMALGVKAGFDPLLLADVLAQGAGSSAMLERYGKKMAEHGHDRDLQGMVKTFYKYFDLIENLAGACDAATPLAQITADYFHRAIDAGYINSDISSIYEIVASDHRRKPV